MGAPPSWSFPTSHAHVLVCLAGDPNLRLRELPDPFARGQKVGDLLEILAGPVAGAPARA